MKIKKFTGKSFQEAFAQVKETLGADAVILNSRKIKEGGLLDFLGNKEIYEITAAVDDKKSAAKTAPMPLKARQAYRVPPEAEPGINGNGNGRNQDIPAPAAAKPVQENSSEIRLLHDEIKDIKNTLNQVSEFLKYSRMPALPEPFKAVLKKLVDNEVHEDLAKAVVQTIYSRMNSSDYQDKGAVLKNVNTLLKRMVKISDPLENAKRRPQVVALVGPTGVGKTTTVAKLAANLKLYSQKKVALISADTYRIAAIEQLQTFANIATLPMKVAYSPEDMRDAVQKLRDFDVVLIDTVGRSQKNEEHLANLNEFIEAANPDEIHLVLSLTTGFHNLQDIVRRFRVMRPNRFIFTKLDEAIHTGNILNVLYKHQLPVSYLTTGQVVPNDIVNAEKETLANLIFKGVMN